MDYEQIRKELTALGFAVNGSEVILNDQVEGWLLFKHGGQNLIDKVSAKPGSRFEQITFTWNISRWPWGRHSPDRYFENFGGE